MLKTNYMAHDAKYRRLLAEGKTGWTTPEEIAEGIADLDQLLAREYVPRTGRGLEIGCGTGELALHLARRGFEAHGIDIAPTAVEWARRLAADRAITVDFRLGNVLDLGDHADNSFDLVVDGLCLHCIIGLDRRKCLDSVRRVLKPGCVFHVRTMCGRINDDAASGFDPQTRCVFYDDIAIRYIGEPDHILAELKSAGFSILRYDVLPARDDRPDTDSLVVDAMK